ncbi:hypothetical protein [Haloarcula salina]|uniref:Uncharacterized protein n=1 Tax=Haloarcula salina TaxID=1429914 RepID=A0AA41G1U5_9EURY|nr:hypothetical protein [Haloarcula salina]MBV0901964.1 hypothetical protein [Haloarcula salina]
MERFVELVVAGGLATVAGLWVTRLAASRSSLWLAGAALAGLGLLALGAGIAREVSPAW